MDTPWDCNRRDSTEMFTISEVDSSGRFRAGSRTGAVSGTMQLVRFNSFNSAGFPLGVQYVETSQSGATLATGTGTFVDANGDGLYDAGRGTGTRGSGTQSVDITISMASWDVTGDANGDYLSIPWSLASMVGVRGTDGCLDPDPQIFVPLADTNADGTPDAVVPDMNGDGVPDANLHRGPPMRPTTAPVPPPPGVLTYFLAEGATGFFGL